MGHVQMNWGMLIGEVGLPGRGKKITRNPGNKYTELIYRLTSLPNISLQFFYDILAVWEMRKPWRSSWFWSLYSSNVREYQISTRSQFTKKNTRTMFWTARDTSPFPAVQRVWRRPTVRMGHHKKITCGMKFRRILPAPDGTLPASGRWDLNCARILPFSGSYGVQMILLSYGWSWV